MGKYTHSLTPQQLSQLGERYYLDQLKDKLEPEHMGEYVIIDVENRRHLVHPDKLEAIELAKKEFGEKLFVIIQIGHLQGPETNFKSKRYGWSI